MSVGVEDAGDDADGADEDHVGEHYRNEGEHHLRVRVLCAEVAVQQYPRQAKNDDRG